MKASIYISWIFPGYIINRVRNLEMLASDHLSPSLLRYGPGRKIKQLHLMGHRLDAFRYEAKFFPNLERLNLYNDDGKFHFAYADYYLVLILKKMYLFDSFNRSTRGNLLWTRA